LIDGIQVRIVVLCVCTIASAAVVGTRHGFSIIACVFAYVATGSAGACVGSHVHAQMEESCTMSFLELPIIDLSGYVKELCSLSA
jgi:hypothetical protein